MRILVAVATAAACLLAGDLSNRRAPGFALMDSGFERFYDPADYRGKILLVDFMSTTCPHCVQFAQVLEELASHNRERVAVLEIVVPPDNQSTVAQYIKEKKITVPVLFDCGQATASYMQATPKHPHIGFPHVFIVDAKGWIRNDYEYSPATKDVFEGRALFDEIDRMLTAPPKAQKR